MRIGTQERWQAETKSRDESATEPLWVRRHDEYEI